MKEIHKKGELEGNEWGLKAAIMKNIENGVKLFFKKS